MRRLFDDYEWEEGRVPNQEVLVEGDRLSPVLGPNGLPYVHLKEPLGFRIGSRFQKK